MASKRGGIAAFAVAAACASGQGRDEDVTVSAGSTGAAASSGEATAGTSSDDTTGSASTSADSGSTDPVTSSSGEATTAANTSTDALTGTTADATGTATGTTADPPPACGDGVVVAPEVCDDGNQLDGDGCNADCQPSGQVVWSTLQGGALGLPDEAWACAVDGNGSIHVAGTIGVSATDDDLWVRKYSSAGDILWTQTHAGSAKAKDQGRAIAVDAAELVYVAGLDNVLMQNNDVLVRKFASDGATLWTKTFSGAALGNDFAGGAALGPTGDLVVGGATTVTDAGTETWLRKFSPAGAVLWTRTYGGAAKGNDATQAIAVTDDGYIYAAGHESVAGEGSNLWVGKFDADGNLLWSRLYNGAAAKNDFLHAAVAMDDGGVVVCGYETADGIPWRSFVRRYDADGLTVWTEVEAGPEAAGALCYGLDVAADGDVLFAGAAIQAGQREPWLRRLAPDGAPRWSTIVTGAGTGASHARCLRRAPDGTLVAAGTLDEGLDGRDIWIARLSP